MSRVDVIGIGGVVKPFFENKEGVKRSLNNER